MKRSDLGQHKASDRITCGWCCLAALLRPFREGYASTFLHLWRNNMHQGLTTKDKLVLLSRHGIMTTPMPLTVEITNIPGIYLCEGVDLKQGIGHSVIIYIDDVEMDIWCMDPKNGQWLDLPPKDFSLTNAIRIDYASSMLLSFQE